MIRIVDYTPPSAATLPRLIALADECAPFTRFLVKAGVNPWDDWNHCIVYGVNAVKLATRYHLAFLDSFDEYKEAVLRLNPECDLRKWFDGFVHRPIPPGQPTFQQWLESSSNAERPEAMALLILSAFSVVCHLQLEMYFRQEGDDRIIGLRFWSRGSDSVFKEYLL